MGDGKIISIEDVKKKVKNDKEIKVKQEAARAIKKKMGQIATLGDVYKAYMQINELRWTVDNDFVYIHAMNRLLIKKRWWQCLFRRSVLTQAEIEAEIKKIVEERNRNAEQQIKKMTSKKPSRGSGQNPGKTRLQPGGVIDKRHDYATPKPLQGQEKAKEPA